MKLPHWLAHDWTDWKYTETSLPDKWVTANTPKGGFWMAMYKPEDVRTCRVCCKTEKRKHEYE